MATASRLQSREVSFRRDDQEHADRLTRLTKAWNDQHSEMLGFEYSENQYLRKIAFEKMKELDGG